MSAAQRAVGIAAVKLMRFGFRAVDEVGATLATARGRGGARRPPRPAVAQPGHPHGSRIRAKRTRRSAGKLRHGIRTEGDAR